jgi:hypothetical protein
MNEATVTFTLDYSPLKSALAEYAKRSRRTTAELLNKAAKNVLIKAVMWTKKGNREAILRAMKYQAVSMKSGKRKARLKTVSKFTPLAYAIQRKKHPGLKGKDLFMAVSRMVGGRLGAVGLLRHGWKPAIEAFGGRAAPFKMSPKWTVGGSKKASEADGKRQFAEFWNNVASAIPVGGQALQIAIDQEASALREMVRKRLEQDAAKAAARSATA